MNILPITLSTLSPVHVGCDEVYEPSNFVIHDGLLHALDVTDLARELTDTERRQLATLAEGREPVGALQRFFRDRAERFAALACHQVAVAPEIVRHYEQYAGRPTQRGPAGEATYNVYPIARTAYRHIDNAPYLPGSSLKGSIRTAWLDQRNQGNPLSRDEQRDRKGAPRHLQERLLGYSAGKFENDPFRHIGLADAHPEDDSTPPPTQVLYAISKKKRLPRDGERGAPELRVFLETLPEALPAAFHGELRLDGDIRWPDLCDACNRFYRPQLEAELNHGVLGDLIDSDWRRLIGGLLGEELAELINARQGFLLRVGRHSGAESVTLHGLRDIKILGPRVDGKQKSDYRPNTTEKRFASQTKSGTAGLLPFGWIWVNACDDAHRHLFDSVQQKLASRSEAVRQAQHDRLIQLEQRQQQQALAAQENEKRRQMAEAAAHAAAEATAAHQAALASMTDNLRRIEEFKTACAARAEQLAGKGKDKPNTVHHQNARELAKAALEGTGWTAEEKRAAADAIETGLPMIVQIDVKDLRKSLKLTALRGG